MKPVPGPCISDALGEVQPLTELWQVDSNGHHRTLLARSHDSDNFEQLVPDFQNLQFSPNGRWLYLNTTALSNASVLHVVDTTNCREHFICRGQIEGFQGINVVVMESVYHRDQGHQMQRFLLSPDGRELAILSEPIDR